MKIAVTGATGFVGQRLVERLQADHHDVLVFARNAQRAARCFPPAQYPSVTVIEYLPQSSGPWQGHLSGCDGVVNLAGEPITSGRWTEKLKQDIMDSRAIGTQKLVEAIAQANPKPAVLVSASAIGYYGTSEAATFTENSPSGSDFLAEVCQKWEAAAQPVTANGTRLVILRIGIVLAIGGALQRMLPIFQLYGGGPIGTGRQWFSWVHRDDLVSLILKALTDSQMSGAYNATAPTPLRMAQFCQTLGKILNRPSWLPVPGFALELLLGEGAQVILTGQRVLPERTQAVGFDFEYAEASSALQQILKD